MLLTLYVIVTPKCVLWQTVKTLVKREDTDEMPHNATYQSQHILLKQTKMIFRESDTS